MPSWERWPLPGRKRLHRWATTGRQLGDLAGRQLGDLAGPLVALGAAVLLSVAPVASAEAPRTGLLAGAARVEIAVPSGTPLAGYGTRRRRLVPPDVAGRLPHAFWLAPHEGRRDPVAARALVLEAGRVRVGWVALDVIAVDLGLGREIAGRLGRYDAPGALMVSASHTHSGPAGILDAGSLGFISMDRVSAEVRGAMVDAAARALQEAERVRVPVTAGLGAARGPGLTAGRLGTRPDDELLVLRLTGERGRDVAVLWHYAIHGTMLGPSSLALSGDVTGVASAHLERELGVPALYVNGAVGDVSPAQHGATPLEETARALATAALTAREAARPARTARLAVATRVVELPTPAVSLRNCLGRAVPRGARLAAGLPLPRQAELTAVAIGRLAVVTLPGELSTSLGVMIKEAGRRAGSQAMVAGLSNGYLGYFVSSAEYEVPGYVTCASLYGPAGGSILAAAAASLVGSLGR